MSRIRLIVLTLVLACAPALAGQTASPAAAPPAPTVAASFAAGNAAYEAGDYATAIERYQDVVKGGIVHPDLDYNLGNAYFKSGDLGHAVLWYERALRLEPRSEDVRANLAVVQAMLRDRQLVQVHSGASEVLLGWHRRLSPSESATVASIFYGLFTLAGLCLIFRRSTFVPAFYRLASWVSPGRLFGLTMAQDMILGMATTAVLAIVFAASSFVKVRDARVQVQGVVVNEEVPVFSGPSQDATIQFKVHEGTVVWTREGRPGWVRVDLPGNLSGWVEAATIERI